VVGPVCESGDVLGLARELPTPAAGALLAIFGAGAYGMSMASTYNTRPRAAEVLVSGSQVDVIRQRETVADLLRGESVPPWLTQGVPE
jgi:diaminopimelate decarboxylase